MPPVSPEMYVLPPACTGPVLGEGSTESMSARRTVLTVNMYEWLPSPRRRLKTIENVGLGAKARGPGSLQGQQEHRDNGCKYAIKICSSPTAAGPSSPTGFGPG